MYADTYGKLEAIFPKYSSLTLTTSLGSLDVSGFADRLWGDIYFDSANRKFTRKQADPDSNRTFVHFVLEPLYKLYSQVLSEETEELKVTLNTLGIKLKPIMYKMDVRPLLKAVLDQFFGPSVGLVDMIVEHIPSPIEGAATKVWSRFLDGKHPRPNPSLGGANLYWSDVLGYRSRYESL